VTQRFHVRFKRPDGWTYEAWPFANDARAEVRAADQLLEYRERIGIRDYLNEEGVTVRSTAQLAVAPSTEGPASDFVLRITRPDGSVIEK